MAANVIIKAIAVPSNILSIRDSGCFGTKIHLNVYESNTFEDFAIPLCIIFRDLKAMSIFNGGYNSIVYFNKLYR